MDVRAAASDENHSHAWGRMYSLKKTRNRNNCVKKANIKNFNVES
jgi:hypothetical protein